jgi:acyl-CoA dehydrogenase
VSTELRENVGQFLDREVLPRLAGGDECIPRELWRSAARAGLLCRTIERAFGGYGDDFFSSAVVIEEIARRRVHSAAPFYLHSEVAVPYIARFGSRAQTRRYLPQCSSGGMIVALALSEAESGSDLRRIRTTASRYGSHYVMEGEKVHVSYGGQADLLVVSAKVGDEGELTLFLVEAPTGGLERAVLSRDGLRGLETAVLRFRNCRVPLGNRLGAEGMGLVYILEMLCAERLVLAIAAHASCRQALGELILHCQGSESSVTRLLDYQNTRFVVADLVSECAVNQVFLEHCIASHAARGVSASDAAISKLRTTEALKRVTAAGVQLRGGLGLTRGPSTPFTQDLLDSAAQTIWGGTSEVMKEVISSDLQRWVSQ